MNRRGFLKGTAAAVTGLGVADVLADVDVPDRYQGEQSPPICPERDDYQAELEADGEIVPYGAIDDQFDIYPLKIWQTKSSLT